MKETPTNRLVGRLPDDHDGARKEEQEERLRSAYFAQIPEDFGAEDELEKTTDEKRIIFEANRASNEILRRYELEEFDVPENAVHIMKDSVLDQNQNFGKHTDAVYASSLQGILIRRNATKIAFAHRLAHEMLHLKSYNAMKVDPNRDLPRRSHRSGLWIRSRDGGVFFDTLNEAIVEELAIKCVRKMMDKRIFRDEKNQTDKLIRDYRRTPSPDGHLAENPEVYFAWIESRTNKTITIETLEFSRKEERAVLGKLIDKIRENNPEYKDNESVFRLFARAAVDGNMLPLRIVDKTFGKGTFRKIGELDKDLNKLEEFIKNLEPITSSTQ